LGLNENAGQRILLRLRTDAYDGYRDYKTILKTLCHELAHNVHGPHDRQFWDLCHHIEREVDATDSAHTLSSEEFYHPPGEADNQGWQGGDHILGGQASVDSSLSLRERRAKAAEARRVARIGGGPNQTSRDDFDKILRENCTLDVASDSVYKTLE
jgi:hypothetical protein